MNPNLIALEEIRFAQPCRADWNRMTGDERARFCGSCHKNVYDISRMTRAEAQKLIAEKEGDLCLRLHRRPDGTVITSDCPVGSSSAARPLWWGMAALTALISATLAGCAATDGAPKSASQALSLADDVAPDVAPQSGAVVAPAPTAIHVATPPMPFDNAEPVPITNHSAATEQLSGMTMGVPMPIEPTATPQSAATPTPSAQYPATTRTLGRIAAPALPVAPDETN